MHMKTFFSTFVLFFDYAFQYWGQDPEQPRTAPGHSASGLCVGFQVIFTLTFVLPKKHLDFFF